MALILAQAQESRLWAELINAISFNAFWVFVAVCVLAATAKHIVHAVLRHRERLAMIEAGMRPDKDDRTIQKDAQRGSATSAITGAGEAH